MTTRTSAAGRAWIWTVLYTAVVLASAAYVRPVATAIRRGLGPAFGLVTALGYVGLGLGLLGAIFRRPAGRPRLVSGLALGLVLTVLAACLAVIPSPEERIHFVEFGLLGGLALRAFEHALPVGWASAAATLYALGIGVTDELYQGILPGRFYDIRDIAMNGIGGVLGWVTLRFVFRVS